MTKTEVETKNKIDTVTAEANAAANVSEVGSKKRKADQVDVKADAKKAKIDETKPVDENVIVLDSADQAKSKKLKKRFNVTEALLCVHSTLNNTIAAICDMNGNVLKQESAGMVFKGSKKGTPHAAYIVADRVAKWATLAGIKCVDARVKGVGTGKDTIVRTLHQRGIVVRSICDMTGVPHGGCRARKARRT